MLVTQTWSDIQIRFVESDGKFFANAKDIAKALGFSNPSEAIKTHVWAEYRYRFNADNSIGQPAWWLTEAGLYQLIFASESELAAPFQRWVFEEVLPSIRKNGGYVRPDATEEQLSGLRAKIDEQVKVALELRSKGLSNGMIEKIMFPAMKNQATRVDGPVTKDSAWIDVQQYLRLNPRVHWSYCVKVMLSRSKYKNLFDANTFKVWKADWMKQGLLKRDGKRWIVD